MARYIDADKAIAMFKEAQKKTNNIIEITSLIGSMAVIDSCQTEDVAPVVHGKWIVNNCIQDSFGITCSACNFKWRNRRYMQYQRYCSHCGAKMDEEELE